MISVEQEWQRERVLRVQQYIDLHLHHPLNREVLADVSGFSIPHFHRVFTAHMGESAISYVRRKRLEGAARKLRMGAVDLLEVALATGYDSLAAFSRAFKRQYGLTPARFRQLPCRAATELIRMKGKLT
ncbi:MAG: helix-turn-helix transcriptional regulator [Anaerolinea sp.]|nr:helix-turn-helix transcriptional regulator [Anaerolinea sp.]